MVLVAMAEKEAKTAGGILLPEATQEREQWGSTHARLLAVSPLAFSYTDRMDWTPPAVGDVVEFTPAPAAESNTIRIGRQPGLVYLQAIIMEEKKLVEKHAAALGLPNAKAEYSIITSGGVMTEAILSDSIDVAMLAKPLKGVLSPWSYDPRA